MAKPKNTLLGFLQSVSESDRFEVSSTSSIVTDVGIENIMLTLIEEYGGYPQLPVDFDWSWYGTNGTTLPKRIAAEFKW